LNLYETSRDLERKLQEHGTSRMRRVTLEIGPRHEGDIVVEQPTYFYVERFRFLADKLSPNLTQLAICTTGDDFLIKNLPARAIGEILAQHATTLRSLSFEGSMDFVGSYEDIGFFADRIASLACLIQFRLGDVWKEDFWIDAVMHALNRIATLEAISIKRGDVFWRREGILRDLCTRGNTSNKERRDLSLVVEDDSGVIPPFVFAPNSRLTKLEVVDSSFEELQMIR